ncbi:MAG: amidohydrolase family protein [Blastocatellia bacterium]|nr:amidohydrolase family protein [Blastocatellia bacterium]
MKRFTVAIFFALYLALQATAQVAVKGETVYTMAGSPIKDGVVLIKDGKIEQVGSASQVKIPANYKLYQAKVVTPGLIDAHTVVGLAGYLNQAHDQDQLDRGSPFQPELRAIDSYNAEEVLVGWVRSFGITTIHTGHSPGALVSGQTMVAKTRGKNVEQATIIASSMIAATLGESAVVRDGKSPGTRSKLIAVLRGELIKAQEYLRKQGLGEDKRPAKDLKMEALSQLLKGETRLLVTVHRANDILSALRIAKEFNIKLVLDGVAEGYTVIDEIKASGFPVIIHPTMLRPAGEAENMTMEAASKLMKAGIAVALQSGSEDYVPKTRVVLFEAATAAANGLSFEEALATITVNAARILGIDKRVGSLEVGKDGDIAMFDGDPFEYTTHVTAVIIEGEVVSNQQR